MHDSGPAPSAAASCPPDKSLYLCHGEKPRSVCLSARPACSGGSLVLFYGGGASPQSTGARMALSQQFFGRPSSSAIHFQRCPPRRHSRPFISPRAFVSWATCYVCIFLLRSFSNDRVCRQTWGPPQALRLVASPRPAAPATARPPANGLDLLGLPRTAPGPVSGRLTPTSRRAGTTPPHPSVASVPSPADTVLFLTSTPVHCPSHVGLINLRA